MKKTGVIALLTIFLSLAIVGCGTNSKPDPIAPAAGPYMFINASSTDVNSSGDSYEIFIQLLKDGAGIGGEEVTIAPFNVVYGYVRPATVITDSDGWAIFTYTSPDNVSALAGQSAILNPIYDDGKGNVLFGSININFVTPTPVCSGAATGTCPSAP